MPVPPEERSCRLRDYEAVKYQLLYALEVHRVSTEERNKKSRSEVQNEVMRKRAEKRNPEKRQTSSESENHEANAETNRTASRFIPTSPVYQFGESENSFPQLPNQIPIYPKASLTMNNPLEMRFPMTQLGPNLFGEMVRLITVEFYTYDALMHKVTLDEDTDALSILVDHKSELKKHEEAISTSFCQPGNGFWTQIVDEKRKQIEKRLEKLGRLKLNSTNPFLRMIKQEEILISDDDDDVQEIQDKKFQRVENKCESKRLVFSSSNIFIKSLKAYETLVYKVCYFA